MKSKILFFMLCGILCCMANAQDCTLDIGGKNTETIVKIFQLNETQIATMETLRGELAIKTKDVEGQIEKLLAEHPQSKEEDLITLADKYKVLQQKIVKASYESDKKLLSVFNTKQYERYLELCNSAIRRPIAVIPMIYRDTISPK